MTTRVCVSTSRRFSCDTYRYLELQLVPLILRLVLLQTLLFQDSLVFCVAFVPCFPSSTCTCIGTLSTRSIHTSTCTAGIGIQWATRPCPRRRRKRNASFSKFLSDTRSTTITSRSLSFLFLAPIPCNDDPFIKTDNDDKEGEVVNPFTLDETNKDMIVKDETYSHLAKVCYPLKFLQRYTLSFCNGLKLKLCSTPTPVGSLS